MHYYPEMLAFEYLEERVMIYQMLDVLHLLKDWSQHTEHYDELDKFITKLTKMSALIEVTS